MSRLTRKFESVIDMGIYEFYHDGIISTGPHIDKLGQLEDIEEELGIDLITLFKALTNGVYHKTKNSIVHYTPTSLQIMKRKEWYLYRLSYTHLKLKNYGNTWALTKEELE